MADHETAETREAQIERTRVEQVFGLTGGELDDAPWEPFVAKLDEYDFDEAYNRVPSPRYERTSFRYHYDGKPDYADDLPRDDEYVTVVSCCLYGFEPETLWERGRRYDRVAFYDSSGETECPCAEGRREGAFEGEDHEGSEPGTWCPLCETDNDDGYIYLGDGWGETVYRVTPVCEACAGPLTSHRDYGDDRCLACDPYALVVEADGYGAYDGGSDVVYAGPDPVAAEAAFALWASRCNVELKLDGAGIREESTASRARAVTAAGREMIRRAESYGGQVDWIAFYVEVEKIRRPWDDFSEALGFVRGCAVTARECGIEPQSWLDGRRISDRRKGFPWTFVDDGSVVPADAYGRIVRVYVWTSTGKIESWTPPREPGEYVLPDGRKFTVE